MELKWYVFYMVRCEESDLSFMVEFTDKKDMNDFLGELGEDVYYLKVISGYTLAERGSN